MNATILNKCIEELRKEVPDLSYLRGMLETLVEVQEIRPVSSVAEHRVVSPRVAGSIPAQAAQTDEAQILDAQARQAIKKVKEIEALNQE